MKSSRKINYVDLVLENCDVIRVPREYIDYVTARIDSKHLFMCNTDEIHEETICTYFYIRFNNLEKLTYTTGFTDDKPESALERLKKWPDITHAEISYGRGKSEVKYYFAVPYKSKTRIPRKLKHMLMFKFWRSDINAKQKLVFLKHYGYIKDYNKYYICIK